MPILLLVAALLLALPAAGAAQPSTRGYVELPTVKGDPLGAHVYRLDNGLTVMLSVNRAVPNVQTLIAVRSGSRNDPADHTGLAHYLEHMLFKGTDRIGAKNYAAERPLLDRIESLYEEYNHATDSAQRRAIYHRIDSVSGLAARLAIPNEYDRLVGSLGAEGTNAWTWFDQTVYTNRIPANQIDRWLTIEGERFRNPVMRLFHTELEAVYEEKNINLDRDEERQSDLAFRLLMPHHPYGTQTTIGTVEHLKNPSITEIRKFLGQYYVPNNMAVIIAGDINPDSVIASVARHFGTLVSRPVNPPHFDPEPPVSGHIEQSVTGPDPESVMIVLRAPGAGTREAVLLDVASSLLDYKDAGSIATNLRKPQRVLSAEAHPLILTDCSVETLSGAPKQGQSLEEVRDLLLKELWRIRDGDFTDDQLKAIVLNKRLDLTRSLESNGGRAYTMLGAFVPNIEWPSYVKQFDDPATVTRQELILFAKRYLADDLVVVFKRQGEQQAMAKVTKPEITPVTLDRESQSDFARAIVSQKSSPLAPTFVDFRTDLSQRQLKPGLTLLTRHNDENDLFTLRYVFEMGKRSDRTLPISFELLPLLGTTDHTAAEISRKLFELGCEVGYSVDDDHTTLSLSGPDAAFEKALALFEEIRQHAKPDQAALSSLVERKLKQRLDAKLDKGEVFWGGLWNYAVYGPRNPFTDQLNEKQLRELNAQDLVRQIADFSGFEHDVLYYGPRAQDAVARIILTQHGVPTNLRAAIPPTVYKPLPTDDSTVYFVNVPMVQAEILWLRTAGRYDPKVEPGRELFNEYFGGGMGSVVFQTIRESRALAYSSNARMRSPSNLVTPYYAYAYIGTQADKLGDAIPAMNDLLQRLPRSEGAFANAVESVRNQITAERVVRDQVLEKYLELRRLGLKSDPRRDVYQALGKLTLDDLERFHHGTYTNGHFRLAVTGSRDRIDMDVLKKYGKVKELSLEDVFGY